MFRISHTLKTISLPVIILSSLALSGCAFFQPEKQSKLSNEPLYALDSVAIQTSRNIQELTDIKTAQLHKSSSDQQWRSFMFDLQAIPPQLAQKESFNYVGQVQDALKGIAELAKYRFYVVGNPPAQPLMISINAKNQSLMDSLRDVNAQIGEKADITLAPNAKLITLTFNQLG
jgi:defect-in-organelle-trafficking protein DotD